MTQYTCFTWGEDDELIVEARVRVVPRELTFQTEYFVTELQVYNLIERSSVQPDAKLHEELAAEAVRRISEGLA